VAIAGTEQLRGGECLDKATIPKGARPHAEAFQVQILTPALSTKYD